MSIFKDCDIRGVYGQELTQRDVYLVGRGLATMQTGAFVAGGDVRLSTPELKAALIEGLTTGGADVWDIGTTATPVFYDALKRLPCAGGCMVTASHNPARYNGVKFMLGDMPVTRATIDRLKAVIDGGAFAQGQGTVRTRDAAPDYLTMLKKRFGVHRGMKVVVDAGNGSMSLFAPEAFKVAGYDTAELFCEVDGAFPNRSPNPAENGILTALSQKVVSEKADFGVAFDGDGDRAVFVTDKGETLVSERTLALMIGYLLRDKPAPVVYDQKSSSVVRDAILRAGGEPVMERSGHTFIKRRFLELGAAVAGEVSGHFFFKELGCDDGLYAALLMGEIIRERGQSLSELVKGIVCPPITPDLRVSCPYDRQDAFLDKIARIGADGTISRMDGVRVSYPDGWVLARKSVTAEQITLRVEAKDEAAMARLKQKFEIEG